MHLHDQIFAVLRGDLSPWIYLGPIEDSRRVELALAGEHLVLSHRPPSAELRGTIDKTLPRLTAPQRHYARRHHLRAFVDLVRHHEMMWIFFGDRLCRRVEGRGQIAKVEVALHD